MLKLFNWLNAVLGSDSFYKVEQLADGQHLSELFRAWNIISMARRLRKLLFWPRLGNSWHIAEANSMMTNFLCMSVTLSNRGNATMPTKKIFLDNNIHQPFDFFLERFNLFYVKGAWAITAPFDFIAEASTDLIHFSCKCVSLWKGRKATLLAHIFKKNRNICGKQCSPAFRFFWKVLIGSMWGSLRNYNSPWPSAITTHFGVWSKFD